MNRKWIHALMIVLCLQACTAQITRFDWMQYDDPEQAGFDATGLEKVKTQFNQMNSATLMVIRNGKVVLAMGDVSRRFMCHSMRKSIMSAMYGIYADRGDVNLYATLEELGIDDKGGLTPQEKQARVLDLLTARSGIYHPAAYEPSGMKENRPERGSSRPGETFFYNNWDFNTLLTIIEKAAHIHFFDAVMQDLARPLGMQDLRMEDMNFRFEPQSVHPAYLFKMSARDLARFGQLYLQHGFWQGKQIIPEKWIRKSTTMYSSDLPGFEEREGYGYLWWVEQDTYTEPCYYASGLGGQRLFVFPESGLVVVHNVNTYLNQSERSGNIKHLVQLILNAETGPISSDPDLTTLPQVEAPTSGAPLTPTEMGRYQRDYRHRFFGNISFMENEGIYFLKGDMLGSFRLIAATSGLFNVEDLPELMVQFLPAMPKHPQGTAETEVMENGVPKRMVFYY